MFGVAVRVMTQWLLHSSWYYVFLVKRGLSRRKTLHHIAPPRHCMYVRSMANDYGMRYIEYDWLFWDGAVKVMYGVDGDRSSEVRGLFHSKS